MIKKNFLWAIFLSLTIAPVSLAAEESVQIPSTEIILSQDGSSVSGEGASVDGNTVTISAGGAYRISGSLKDGLICVDAGDSDSIGIALDGVELANKSGSAIEIENAQDVTLYLSDGSENSIAGGSDSEADAQDSAIFSGTALTISGSGSLSVNGYADSGICCTGDLTISGGGQITIDSPGPGITAKGAVMIGSCTMNIQ